MVERTRITAQEYFEQPETNLPMALIDGVVMSSPAPTPNHQIIVFKVGKLIDRIMTDGEMLLSPIDVHLDDHNVIQPDILWIAPDSQCVIDDKRLRGAPDLVIEVLSPSTARDDKTVKFRLYERHGSRELWLIDPTAEYVEVWRRENDVFVHDGVYGPADSFQSAVLRATVNCAHIFGEK
jgi:Uma2 family endonuclease